MPLLIAVICNIFQPFAPVNNQRGSFTQRASIRRGIDGVKRSRVKVRTAAALTMLAVERKSVQRTPSMGGRGDGKCPIYRARHKSCRPAYPIPVLGQHPRPKREEKYIQGAGPTPFCCREGVSWPRPDGRNTRISSHQSPHQRTCALRVTRLMTRARNRQGSASVIPVASQRRPNERTEKRADSASAEKPEAALRRRRRRTCHLSAGGRPW